MKNRSLDEFFEVCMDACQPRRCGLLCASAIWVFQIEHFFERDEAGMAFMTFYYVVATAMLRGCVNEYRENDF